MADGYSPTSPPLSPSLRPASPPDSPAFIALNNRYDYWGNLVEPDQVNGFNPAAQFHNPPDDPNLALSGPSSSQVPPVIQSESAETPREEEENPALSPTSLYLKTLDSFFDDFDLESPWPETPQPQSPVPASASPLSGSFHDASNQSANEEDRNSSDPNASPTLPVTEEKRAESRREEEEPPGLGTTASSKNNELETTTQNADRDPSTPSADRDWISASSEQPSSYHPSGSGGSDGSDKPEDSDKLDSEDSDKLDDSDKPDESDSDDSDSDDSDKSDDSEKPDDSDKSDDSEKPDDSDKSDDDTAEPRHGEEDTSPGSQNPGPNPGPSNSGPSDPGPSHHIPPQILGKRRRDDSPDNHEMSSKLLKEEQPSGSFHQDYIASLRYRNDLPPPDMPPKFLDIPHEGLSRFLTPGFASNLARREEPNIDVDAEGGMPIDMVGIPGLHLGDESAIMAPENPQPIDPADLPLLMPLDQLRNPAPKNTNVSFLRRTQHISVERNAPSGAGSTTVNTQSRPLKKPKVSVDDPKHVKKLVQKGFDVAYPESKYTGEDTESHIRGLPATKAEIDAWANPVHPDNPKLKAVGFFAVLPDLEGFTDPGGLVQFKFDKAPVSAVGGKRDKRMDVALLRPSAPEDRICEEHAQKVALHKANPEVYPDPGPIPWDYDLFLSEKSESVKKIGISMDPKNPNRDNEELYAHEGTEGHKFHRYDRVRTYATSAQTLNTDQKQRDIALTLFQPLEGETKQQAAYYYPILGKTRLKPERARTIAQAGLAPTASQVKEDQIDQMQVAVRDPDESEVYKRALHRANIDPEFAKTLGPPPEPPVAEQDSPDALGEEVAEKAEEDTRMSDE